MNSFNPEILSISNRYFEYIEDFPVRKPKASWKLVDWVVKHSILTGNSKLVAAAIASFYSKNNGFAVVRVEKIRAATGLSESAISTAIKNMKLSGEWLVYTVNTGDVYSTFQRYVPLSPTINNPGEVLNLEMLASKLDSRHQDKGGSSNRIRKTALDFHKIWESHWTKDIMRSNLTLLTTKSKDDNIAKDEKDFLKHYITKLNKLNPDEKNSFYHASFSYLRGNDFAHRALVDSSREFKTINWDKKLRNKLAIELYTSWGALFLATKEAEPLKKSVRF